MMHDEVREGMTVKRFVEVASSYGCLNVRFTETDMGAFFRMFPEVKKLLDDVEQREWDAGYNKGHKDGYDEAGQDS